MKRLLLALVCLFCIAGCEYQPQPATPVASPTPISWQTEGKHVLAFTLETCGQCKADKPQLEQLRDSGIDVIEIYGDHESDRELVAKYKSNNKYPEYVVLEDGEVKARSLSIATIFVILHVAFKIAMFLLL
jgi:thiol-disulfide isomerase/thioredoxin